MMAFTTGGRIVSLLLMSVFAAAPAIAADVTPMTYESVLLDASPSVDVGGCTDVAVVNIHDIRFDLDSAKLKPEATVQMDDLARVMRERRFVHDRFLIEGHADASGTDAHNMDLSHRRAETVRNALIQRGIPGERVSTRAYGERRLLLPDDPDHAYNRRVGFVVLAAGAVVSEAATQVDRGAAALSVQVRVIEEGTKTSYIADPSLQIFEAGDAFFLCVAASRPGILYVENQSDGRGPFNAIKHWSVPAEALLRHPPRGAFRIAEAASSETIRLKLITCEAEGMNCVGAFNAGFRFESIQQGRARPRNAPTSTPAQSAAGCDARGVICRDIVLKRR